jgi:hypothetical protein
LRAVSRLSLPFAATEGGSSMTRPTVRLCRDACGAVLGAVLGAVESLVIEILPLQGRSNCPVRCRVPNALTGKSAYVPQPPHPRMEGIEC